MKHFILFLAIFMVSPLSSFGQNVFKKGVGKLMAKENEKAKEVYDESGYMSYVEKMPEEHKEDKASIIKMANSYRMNSKTAQAEFWYAKFMHNNTKAIHFLHYAQVLQSNGKCEEAIKWFKKYQDTEKEEGENISRRKFIKNCDELSQIKEHPEITLANVSVLNSSHLEFSAIPYDDNRVVFTSTRGKVGFTETKDSWTNDNFSDLFIAKENSEGELSEPTPLLGNIDAQFHDGTATFDQNKNLMIFTRNDSKKKKKDSNKLNLKIYMSSNDQEGAWSSPTELPFNGSDFNTCHPTLSKDEKRLFFSSNRPGGFGGMDLYVSEWSEGKWQEPVNMGADINSADNEIFPFISDDETLYFASNGHKGLGGLDIFRTISIENNWTTVENIGKPYNTTSDDFGFFTNAENTKGYLSSNRKGGLGGDDIYKWSRDEEIIIRSICVLNKATDQPMSNVQVTITEQITNKVEEEVKEDLLLTLKEVEDKEFVFSVSDVNKDNTPKVKVLNTDDTGKINYEIKPGSNYTISVEKEGFSVYQEVLDAEALLANVEHCFPLEKSTCKNWNIKVLDKATEAMLPKAMVTVINNTLNTEKKYPLNDDGTFDFCMDDKNNYTIKADHIGYIGSQKIISKSELKEGEDIVLYVSQPAVAQQPVAISSLPVVTNYPPVVNQYTPPTVVNNYPVNPYPAPTVNYPSTTVAKINELHEYFLGGKANKFKVNQIIVLKDVYYDYDKFDIRTDASKGLNHVVELLNLYPSMEISLRSHTDARGNDAYNETLSQKRAQEAMTYILERGISPTRVSFTGLGESTLKNRCGNDVNCSEIEHQENRRTEIRITKLDADVEVRYQK